MFTKYQLKTRLADKQGIHIRYEQMDNLIRSGVLPEPDTEGWREEEAEAVLARFLKAHEMREAHWGYQRRTIQLWLEFRREGLSSMHSIDPRKLQSAMHDAIQTIDTPVRKMKAVVTARRGEIGGVRNQSRLRTAPIRGNSGVNNWERLIESAEPDFFDSRVDFVPFEISTLTGTLGPQFPSKIILRSNESIADVELATLIMIDELFLMEELSQQSIRAEETLAASW